jgi:SAM-dependent methyltransferase
VAGRCDRPKDAARERVAALAREALARGEPTSWFEKLYREASGDASRVPWADLAPVPSLAAWTARPASLRGVRTAAVVGCGLGHDAEHLAAKGIDVWAFDVSPAAIEWAKRLHSHSRVRYEVADLFSLPAPRRGRFDLAVEVYTLQALPVRARPAAAAAIRSLLAPGGRLFVFTRLRDDGPGSAPYDESVSGPPWPLGRAEAGTLFGGLSVETPFVELRDPDDPSIVRAWGVFRA